MRFPIKKCTLFAVCSLSAHVMVNSVAASVLVKRQSSPSASFNWSLIEPSVQLKWTACFDKFECARFQVPLDYADASAGNGAIAVIRSPSPLSRNDTRYQGPVLFNPGGPGGSGVEDLQVGADLLRGVLGDAFDIVGFDPRGVGATTPFMTSFVSGTEAGLYWLTRTQTVNHSAEAFGTAYANAKNFGAVSASRSGQLAQYVGSPALARDMLGIVRAHGFEKLQYLGISYGTVLGATFAAMFPNNIGRMVLDGVFDATDYYKGIWLNSIVDADKVIELLYESCVSVGPAGCPMYESSADKIRLRVQTLLNKVKLNPVPVFIKSEDPSLDTYGVVDYSTVKLAMFSTTYTPSALGPSLLASLADLEKGNGTALWSASSAANFQDLVTQPATCPPPLPQDVPAGSTPNVLIACGDGDPVTDDVDTLRKKYSKAAETSSFAEAWTMQMFCSGWTIRAKERFNASFETNTSYPILFVSNTADPVTPLRSAHKMSGLFGNSALLTHNTSGHTALLNPSKCALSAMGEYFQQDVLPNASTVCQPDSGDTGNSTIEMVLRGNQLGDTLLESFKRFSVLKPLTLF